MRRPLLPLLVLLGGSGCERPLAEDDRLVREGADELAALSLRLQPRPPPPPPPPTVLPVPEEIVTFVRAHATDTAPWKVTLYELPAVKPKPPLFMGAYVQRRHVLGRATSVRAIAKLLQPIYSDGACGCATDVSTGIRIARGAATLDLVYNAGHLFLTPEGHDGRYVILLDAEWLHELR